MAKKFGQLQTDDLRCYFVGFYPLKGFPNKTKEDKTR